jgi:hypothetical protein
VEGETGVFFERPEPGLLVDAVRDFDPLAVDPEGCVANAARFDVAHFRHGLRGLVDRALEEERPPRPRPRRARGLALSQP